MFYDNPEIMYENPPPPSDYESEDEDELPVFVIPDEYKYANCIKIDPSIAYVQVNDFTDEEEHVLERIRKYKSIKVKNIEITEDSKKEKHSKVGETVKSSYAEIVGVKQERKQAGRFESEKSDYRCDICDVELNGPKTYHLHMSGKKHNKAVKLLLEIQARKSAEPVVMDYKTFPKQPGRVRIRLYDVESKMQRACDSKGLILGLDNVVEIRGYEEVKYFCDLCSATCSISTLRSHLVGYRHQMSCLKKYNRKTYLSCKDRKDRRTYRELAEKLEEAERKFGRGKIRVFIDVMKILHPEPYDPSKPSTSKQGLEEQPEGFVQTFDMEDEPKVTDAQFLMKQCGDFICKICLASMLNLPKWEEHVRGKRHMKNRLARN